jgi:hypothetical protein
LVSRSSTNTDYPQTLAELRFMAIEGNERQAINAYKEMGDRALFVSGFFRGSLRSRIVNTDYYFSMGSMAYASLFGLLNSSFFEELSKRFVFFSELLRDISLHINKSKSDLILLYDEWLKTKDPKLERRLFRMGLNTEALIIA